MLSREIIIEELQKKYPQYHIVSKDIVKNGNVCLEGICISDGSAVAPMIYMQSITERCGDDLDHAIEFVTGLLEQDPTPDIDVDKLTDPSFILENIRIGIQKESDEKNLVKRTVDADFPGMEQYLYLSGSRPVSQGIWSMKLSPELVESVHISDELVWEIAKKHTLEATTIKPMSEVLAEIAGADFKTGFNDMAPYEMYVISNREKYKGAAGIINHELLESLAKQHACKSLCVLPSSIHEAILVPLHDESYSMEDFNAMVKKVNETQVSPEEQLVDRAYVIRFEK